MLYAWAGTFGSDREPDFWIEFELREGRSASEIQQMMAQVRVRASGNQAHSVPSLWESEISWAGRRLVFRAERALFAPAIQPRFLNVLFSSVYNTACESGRAEKRGAYLFHGCGVVVDGKGFLFTGPSGAGKTTVARLAGRRAVLNDEAVLLRRAQDGLWIGGTPLLGGVQRRTKGWYPLHAVLNLAHGERASLHPLNGLEAYPRFLMQLFDTAPLIPPEVDRDGLSFLAGRAALAASATSEIPMYELHFRPDDPGPADGQQRGADEGAVGPGRRAAGRDADRL